MHTDSLLLILGMVAATYSSRYLPFALLEGREMPLLMRRFLRFVPVSVLTALIVLMTVTPRGTIDLRLTNAYLWGGAASAIVAWRTRRLLPTIALGMVFFWLWRFLLG